MLRRVIILGSLALVLAAVLLLRDWDGLIRPSARSQLKKPSKELVALRKAVKGKVKRAIKALKDDSDSDRRSEDREGAGIESFDVNTREGLVGLLELIRQAGMEARMEIMQKLMGAESTAGLDILHDSLFASDGFVRMGAAAAISSIADPQSVEPLMKYVGQVRAEDFKSGTIVGFLGMSENFAYMQSLLMSIEALGDIGDARALPVLKQHMGDELQQHMTGDVIVEAVAKLGPEGEREARKYPQEFAWYVAGIEDPKRIYDLIRMLEDEKEYPVVRSAAATALGSSKDPTVAEHLLAQTGGKDKDVKIAAYDALLTLDRNVSTSMRHFLFEITVSSPREDDRWLLGSLLVQLPLP